MYSVSVTNNYRYALTTSLGTDTITPNGGTATIDRQGNFYINVPGMGPINFIDLGDTKLNAYTDPRLPWTEKTWGGLVRYHSLDAYFRYEGGGSVNLAVAADGSISLHFAQGGAVISLPDVVVS